MNAATDSCASGLPGTGRRLFLRQAAGAAALWCAAGEVAGQVAQDLPTIYPSAPGPADTVYLSFGPEEADCVEAMVEHMCPRDELTPGGVDCGLAVFIDRELAGAYGHGDRLYLRGPFRPGLPEDGYQLSMTPAQYFKSGCRALDQNCQRRLGAVFARLDANAKESCLLEISTNRWDETGEFSLGAWFNELFYPLFTQACFSDPVYGGNRDKVFWRLLGYPGLPATYGRDMVTYRGRPHPAAHTPRSMQDFA